MRNILRNCKFVQSKHCVKQHLIKVTAHYTSYNIAPVSTKRNNIHKSKKTNNNANSIVNKL